MATPSMGPAFNLGQQMFNKGKGLLSAPVMGNGFGSVQAPTATAAPSGNVAGNGFGQVAPKVAGNGFGQVAPKVAGNGFGLVAPKVASNGFGQVRMDANNFRSNPYINGMVGDIRNQTNDLLGDALLGIQGNSVASGGLGGSRQGIAQGTALAKGADYLSGNVANLLGGLYENEENRILQKYQADQGFYGQQRQQDIDLRGQQQDFYNAQRGQDIALRGQQQDFYNTQRGQDIALRGQQQDFYTQQRGQDLARRGQNLDAWNSNANRALQQYNMDQGFYTAQRGQDLAQYGLGGNMIQQGLNTQWLPMQNAASVYSPFTGFGSTTNSSQQGGGWQGALGGGLGVLGLGSQLNWW